MTMRGTKRMSSLSSLEVAKEEQNSSDRTQRMNKKSELENESHECRCLVCCLPIEPYG